MSDKDIMIEVLNGKLQGVMYHSDFASFAHLFGLKGTFRYHRYRAKEELDCFHAIEKYIIDHYGVIPDSHNQFKSFNPHTLKGKEVDRLDIKHTETKSMLSMIMSTHIEWEKMAKKSIIEAMEKIECEEAELFLEDMLKDVAQEIIDAEKRMMWYNNTGWDMGVIMEHQKHLHKKYKDK